ncbi:MAG TPA: WD40 repeat domain-containing protein [Tepidisphaeraceae bacterium]|jgi:WD40 repeat protein|nr:WD40 repeat domain-containing protein [Tepidisphaeraceae bacterium]
MNGRIWIKRAIAFVVAAVAVGFAWHSIADYYGLQSPPKATKPNAAAPRPAASFLSSGKPPTRPTTNPARKPQIARVAPRPASTEPVGEREGRDLHHGYDPRDPFRIARANRHIDGPTETVRAVALSRDKTKLVTGGNDRTVRLFDFASGKELRHFEGHTRFILGVDISPDNSRIISCGEDHTIRVWDANTGEQLAEMEHQDEVIATYFLSDPNQAISASSDGTARIWDIDKETTIQKIDYQRRVCSMAICLPANLLAVGTHVGDVYLWDLKTRTQIRQLDKVPSCIHALTISGDGKKLAILPTMEKFRIVEVATGKMLLEEPQAEWDRTWSAALTSDGQMLALGRGYQVILYDLQTFKRLKTYLNPNAFSQAMCFIPDSFNLIVAGGGFEQKGGEWMRPWDDTILIFNLPKPLP